MAKKRRGRPPGSKNKKKVGRPAGVKGLTKNFAKMEVGQLRDYIGRLEETLAAKIQQARQEHSHCVCLARTRSRPTVLHLSPPSLHHRGRERPQRKPRAAERDAAGVQVDITADVLKSEGFSPNAIQTVQSANFFVDFYDFMDHPKVKPALNAACLQRAAPAMAAAHFQHFDMLDSKYDVARRWDAMLAATDSVAIAKTKRGDILGLMALLGASPASVRSLHRPSLQSCASASKPPDWRSSDASQQYANHQGDRRIHRPGIA